MVFTSAEVRAALIAPTYHILLGVDDTEEVFSNIRIVETAGANSIARQSRPPSTAGSEFVSASFIWNDVAHDELKSQREMERECGIAKREDVENVVRSIQSSAQQRGERIPDDNEARAMATLARTTRAIISESK
jgi:hypothetical protein